ncbi:MAG: hypothetical protein MHM6MM_002178 [Cercozoa sp. M6MM]
MSELDHLVSEAKELTSNDKIFAAHDIFDRIVEIDDSVLRDCEEFQLVTRRVQECREMLANFEGEEWTRTQSRHGISTFYRAEEGSNTYSFKVEGILDRSVFDLVAVLFEVDLFSEWFPFLRRATELARPARFRKLIHMDIKLPWPLAPRDALLDAYGVDDSKSGRVFCFLGPLAPDELEKHAPEHISLLEPSHGTVRANVKHAGVVFQLLPDGRCFFREIINVDPQLAVVPYALLNFFTGKLLYFIVANMNNTAEKCSDPESEYSRRIKANPEVYEYLREVLATCKHDGDEEPEPREDSSSL